MPVFFEYICTVIFIQAMRSVIMKDLAVCALCVVTAFSASAQSAGDDPVADSKAVVVSGNARFTVLESRLVRMEWAADGKFEDRATLGVVNRKLPVPAYTVKKSGKKLEIKLDEGALYFEVNEKLAGDESMTIGTSTISLSIIGTAGVVRKRNISGNTQDTLWLLDGQVELTGIGTAAGREPITVWGGERIDYV